MSDRGQTERTAGGSRGVPRCSKNRPGECQNPVERQFKGLDIRLRANILPSGKYRQGIGKYHKLEYEGDMMKRNLIFGIAVAACLAAAGYYAYNRAQGR